MNLYFAPLEGIGGYIYRNAQADYFEKADKYFSPFLAPNQNRSISPKEYKDIAPEHNEGIYLVPQIMANNAEIFLKAAQELEQLGYREVNLNLGCPSRTVVTKYRGAGFLAKPDMLETFLEEVYSKINIKLSIKTRLGMEEEDEFEQLLEIYNKFPVSELIIHPRVQTDYYKNTLRMEAFLKALAKSKNPVVYNGDIFSKEKYEQVLNKISVCEYTKLENQWGGVMLGRGVLANPALFGEIRGSEWKDATSGNEVFSGKKSSMKGTSDEISGTEILTKDRLREFHERLITDYSQEMSGERNVLFKMKELWFYMAQSFEHPEKYEKKIRKAQHLNEYRLAVRQLFAECELIQ